MLLLAAAVLLLLLAAEQSALAACLRMKSWSDDLQRQRPSTFPSRKLSFMRVLPFWWLKYRRLYCQSTWNAWIGLLVVLFTVGWQFFSSWHWNISIPMYIMRFWMWKRFLSNHHTFITVVGDARLCHCKFYLASCVLFWIPGGTYFVDCSHGIQKWLD